MSKPQRRRGFDPLQDALGPVLAAQADAEDPQATPPPSPDVPLKLVDAANPDAQPTDTVALIRAALAALTPEELADVLAQVDTVALQEAWASRDNRLLLRPGHTPDRAGAKQIGPRIDGGLYRRLKFLSLQADEGIESIITRALEVAVELGERELGTYKEPDA